VVGFPEDASVSLALLAERTRTLGSAADGSSLNVRWSLRARLRRRLGEGLRLTHVTWYQPTVDAPGRYTVETTTVLAVPLRSGLELTGTLRERYDSEARRRGARSDHDGQLLFGVRTSF
jgi:hypothetical protein